VRNQTRLTAKTARGSARRGRCPKDTAKQRGTWVIRHLRSTAAIIALAARMDGADAAERPESQSRRAATAAVIAAQRPRTWEDPSRPGRTAAAVGMPVLRCQGGVSDHGERRMRRRGRRLGRAVSRGSSRSPTQASAALGLGNEFQRFRLFTSGQTLHKFAVETMRRNPYVVELCISRLAGTRRDASSAAASATNARCPTTMRVSSSALV